MLHSIRRGALLALAIALAGTATAHAESTRFYSSFEPGDPQPRWTSTAERTQNVTGSVSARMPGSVMEDVTEVQASGENPPSETKERGVDGSASSKWLTFASTGWLQVQLAHPAVVVRYALTSANDAPERDPQDWQLQGSNDGTSWTTLDTRAGQDFADRFQTTEYDVANSTRVQLLPARHHRQPQRRHHPARRPGALRRRHDAAAADRHARGRRRRPGERLEHQAVGRLDRPAGAPVRRRPHRRRPRIRLQQGLRRRHPGHRQTELSYMIFPEFTGDDLQYPSTYTAVDLAFTDGTYLCRPRATASRRRAAQGRSKVLYADQWNRRSSRHRRRRARQDDRPHPRRLRQPRRQRQDRASAAGSTTSTIADRRPARPTRTRPTGSSTTRGTNSSGSFSRGNNIPATAVPHGFNFWTPVTDAGSLELALPLPGGQQRRQPARAAGALDQPRAEPVDGRPPDVPGDAVGGRRHAADRPRRARARVQPRRTRSPARTTTGSRSRTG